MIRKKIICFVWIVFIVTCGCKRGNTGRDNGKSQVEAQDHKPSKMNFERIYYDFGKVVQGEKVSYAFKFKNAGDSELIIEDAYGGCGCTVPKYNQKPIAPGKEGFVEVIFDSAGLRGSQYKSLVVKSNASNGKIRLTIKADVLIN